VVASHAKDEGFSYPADKPVKRIDHIFYRERFKAAESFYYSDAGVLIMCR
jgi:hypothetical protein